MKTYSGTLINYGSAPYQDNPQNSMSYFVEIENAGLKQKVWGVDLEKATQNMSAQLGDRIVVNNLGSQVVSIVDPETNKSKNVKRNLWEIEKYEPYHQNLTNEIEQDIQLEKEKRSQHEYSEKTKENSTPALQNTKDNDVDHLPDSIKYNYVAMIKNRLLGDEKINYYDKSDRDKFNIAFEDRKSSINTSRQDEKTISAMIDLAESKGWKSIKLKGTQEFKQKAWLEASLRGIETSGYTPTEQDKAELMAKQALRTQNQVEVGSTQQSEYKPLDQEKYQMDSKSQYNLNHKTAKEVRTEIRDIIQEGYRNGLISDRSDLIKILVEKGYAIDKENEKSIRLKLPNSEQSLTLKGHMFTKDFNALKELKENLTPENIKNNYPHLSDTAIAQITAWKNHIERRFDTPQAQQKAFSRLNDSIKDMANGKDLAMPSIPQNETMPDIEVKTPDHGSQSRSR